LIHRNVAETLLSMLRRFAWFCNRGNGHPRCVGVVDEVDFADLIRNVSANDRVGENTPADFAGAEEDQAEPRDDIPLDGIAADEDVANGFDPVREADDEADLLGQMPSPGFPEKEKERHLQWLCSPRRARVAARRFDRNFKHLLENSWIHVLRAAKRPNQYVDAATAHRRVWHHQARANYASGSKGIDAFK
jgi:hypothetical protein